jgi:hypothetical protein
MPPESPSADRAAPQEFSIATPADWMVIDLELLGDRAVIGALVDQRVAEEPALDAYRDEIAELVSSNAELAGEMGVMFCATLAAVPEAGAPVLATLTVAAGEQDPAEAAAARSAAQNGEHSGELLVNPVDEPDGRTSFAPVAVRLSAGPAARVEHIDDVPLFTDTSMVCLTVQYVLEVPEAPDQFIALTFTTPSLAYRARLTELFADMAETFAWV